MKKIYSFIVLALFLTACSGDEAEVTEVQEIPPALVVTEVVTLADVPVYIRAVGNVEAQSSVSIIARTGEELLETLVSEGDMVDANTVLFRQQTTQLEVDLRSAQASLDMSRASLAKAQSDLRRNNELASQGFASTSQLEQLRLAVTNAEVSIEVAEANIERIELALSYADITTPIEGRVGAISADEGNILMAGSALTTVSNIDNVSVTFAVPERYLSSLRAEAELGVVPVFATTIDGLVVEGVLTFIDNVSTLSGTFNAKAEFANEDHTLWVGQFVDINVQMELLEDVTIVPEKAVSLSVDGPFVYIVENDVAMLRLVETGIEEDGMIVVNSGLEAGENVVVDGHVRLFDNARVAQVAAE